MDSNTTLQTLGTKFHNKNGECDNTTLKTSKLIGVYFSAHWCPPCRGFTPQLVQFYNEVNKTEQTMEIVFVTSDRSEEDFNNYFKEMPWIALPFGDERIQSLKTLFSVRGIPMFVVMKSDGTLITQDGRNDVTNSGSACVAQWLK